MTRERQLEEQAYKQAYPDPDHCKQVRFGCQFPLDLFFIEPVLL